MRYAKTSMANNAFRCSGQLRGTCLSACAATRSLIQYRSIIATIQETDSFTYSERSARNKDGGDGARFRYVCLDSMQNRYRKSNKKKDVSHDSDGSDVEAEKNGNGVLPTYDCGGAVHIKFSLKREAINVVYKHNPIHMARPASDG